MITFDNLIPSQRRAVDWRSGPLLVIAGPGSGKTLVLALRVARLLEETEDAFALGLTSTNKAAAEMRERVDQFLGGHTDRARFNTFHAFAANILGQHGSHIGIRPNFRSLTRDDNRIVILEEVIRGLPDGDAALPSDRTNLLHLIDRLFSESYAGNGPSSSLATTPCWLPTLFRQYCDALIAANCLDFGSLLHFANLRQKPAVARVVRLGWTHICVDEFQDTNQAQYDLLRLIAPERGHNLFVVADDDQIIYQRNGASPKRFDDLQDDYDLRVIQLPESYRCPSEIVDLANRLIGHNRRLIPSRTTSSMRVQQAPYAGVVRLGVYGSLDEEAAFIGDDIRERGLAPSDCAVLGRNNRLVQAIAEALRREGHEVFVPLRKSDFDSPVPGVLVEVLRLADSRHDRVVLRGLCHRWERMTGTVINPHAVGSAAALVGGDFLRAWVEAAAESGDSPELQRIRTDLVDGMNFPGIVDAFLDGEWRQWGDSRPDEAVDEDVETLRILHGDIVREYGPGVTLNRYLQILDHSSKSPPAAPNAVQCITVHRSKGLEFKHVYVIGMAQSVFPSYRAIRPGAKRKDIEKGRRSCFVAITRAQETLTLTRARRYFGYEKSASQFLDEMAVGGQSSGANPGECLNRRTNADQ